MCTVESSIVLSSEIVKAEYQDERKVDQGVGVEMSGLNLFWHLHAKVIGIHHDAEAAEMGDDVKKVCYPISEGLLECCENQRKNEGTQTGNHLYEEWLVEASKFNSLAKMETMTG